MKLSAVLIKHKNSTIQIRKTYLIFWKRGNK